MSHGLVDWLRETSNEGRLEAYIQRYPVFKAPSIEDSLSSFQLDIVAGVDGERDDSLLGKTLKLTINKKNLLYEYEVLCKFT